MAEDDTNDDGIDLAGILAGAAAVPTALDALRKMVSPVLPLTLDRFERGCHVALPPGYTIESVELMQEQPNRIREGRIFRDVESLGAYIARFGTDDTIITADKSQAVITAEIDYHSEVFWHRAEANDDGFVAEAYSDAIPSHASHKASFVATHSPEYAAWRALDGNWLAQHTFGEFLEDRAPDVHKPAAADVMTMVLQFEATRKVEFKSATRLANGTRQITYNEADSGPKGVVVFPEAFVLSIPIYEGGPAEQFLVRIRYDIDGGVLKFKPIIAERKRLEERAFDGCIDKLKAIVAAAPCKDRPLYLGPVARPNHR